MSETISIEEAVMLWLNTFNRRAAFFESELISLLYRLREDKSFQNQKIRNLRKDANLKRLFREVVEYLVSNEMVKQTSSGYFIISNSEVSDLEVVCSLYPSGYISYLSAMRYYNLTNRFPKNIDFVAPPRSIWKKEQLTTLENKNIHDLKLGDNKFITPYPSKHVRVKRKYLNVHSRTPSYREETKGDILRIIRIGDLFIEMLRYPELCGGFQHVFEIYEEMGEVLLEEIIESVEEFGSHIDKCRIGFILQCHLNIDDERIREWQASSPSRGGSRKMVSSLPYADYYSEVWCISLNHSLFGN